MSGSGPVWVAGFVTARAARGPPAFPTAGLRGIRQYPRPWAQGGRGAVIGDPAYGWGREGGAMSGPKESGHLVPNVTDGERSTRLHRDAVGFQVSRDRHGGGRA